MATDIRPIEPRDNAALAAVIRKCMEEFDLALEGTVYNDPETDHMSAQYTAEDASYWVATVDGELVGGAGIRRLTGAEGAVCELQRMFLSEAARGKGLGKALMQMCIDFARAAGYDSIYLESSPGMKAARRLYKGFGFETLDGPLGTTGHFSCQVWMLKKL